MWRTFGNVIKLWDLCAPLSRSASLSAGDMAYDETHSRRAIITTLLPDYYIIMTRQLGETISVNGGAARRWRSSADADQNSIPVRQRPSPVIKSS